MNSTRLVSAIPSQRIDSAITSPAEQVQDAPAGLYRATMRFLFYSLFLVSLMLTFVHLSPIRLVIPFGTSQLREVDILYLAFIGLWVIGVLLRGKLRHHRTYRLLYLLILVLVLPMFTGLASGKSFVVVLRDFRTPLFFLGILPMLDVLRTYADLRGLVRFMVVIGIFSLLVGIVWWLIGSRSDYIAVGYYRFGISSALSLNVWLIFLAIALASSAEAAPSLRKWAWVYVFLGMGFVFFANDARSIYVGVLGGLLFLGVVLNLKRHSLQSKRSVQQFSLVILCLFALLGPLLLLAISFGLDFQAMVLQDMRLARLYSLFEPAQGFTSDSYIGSNVGSRLLGVSYGFDLGTRNGGLGMGYGDNVFVDLDDRIIRFLVDTNYLAGNPGNTIENLLFTHNSYGWAFGRLGLWLALSYFALILRISFQAWKAMLKTSLVPLRVILLGTLTFVLYVLLLGFGGGGFFDYTGQGLITWLVCLAVLIRGVVLAQQNKDGSSMASVGLLRLHVASD